MRGHGCTAPVPRVRTRQEMRLGRQVLGAHACATAHVHPLPLMARAHCLPGVPPGPEAGSGPGYPLAEAVPCFSQKPQGLGSPLQCSARDTRLPGEHCGGGHMPTMSQFPQLHPVHPTAGQAGAESLATHAHRDSWCWHSFCWDCWHHGALCGVIIHPWALASAGQGATSPRCPRRGVDGDGLTGTGGMAGGHHPVLQV